MTLNSPQLSLLKFFAINLPLQPSHAAHSFVLDKITCKMKALTKNSFTTFKGAPYYFLMASEASTAGASLMDFYGHQ